MTKYFENSIDTLQCYICLQSIKRVLIMFHRKYNIIRTLSITDIVVLAKLMTSMIFSAQIKCATLFGNNILLIKATIYSS